MLYSTTAMATQNNHIVMRFAVVSDLHDWKGSEEKDLNNFINWSNNEHNSSLGLNYTFFNGDMFSGSNNVSYNNLSMKTLQDNYFSKLLNPYHYVIGNNEGLTDSNFSSLYNYSKDSLIPDGNFTFVFLNSEYGNIANTTYLNSALDTYANKTVFVFIHVSQIGRPFDDGHTPVTNEEFINIIGLHPNVVAVINGHNHGVNACYQNYNNTSIYNTSIYNCWDGCLATGDPFSGARIFEVYDDGQVLTYEYSLTTNQTVNMDIIYPLDTNKITSSQKIYFGHRLNNTISPDGNVTYFPRSVYTNIDSAVNMTVIPSGGTVNVSVSQWNTSGNYEKTWSESASNNSIATQHWIGSFPAGKLITISRDGDYYATVQSNSTGYIEWTYTEGYGDHTFDATLSLSQNIPVATAEKAE